MMRGRYLCSVAAMALASTSVAAQAQSLKSEADEAQTSVRHLCFCPPSPDCPFPTFEDLKGGAHG